MSDDYIISWIGNAFDDGYNEGKKKACKEIAKKLKPILPNFDYDRGNADNTRELVWDLIVEYLFDGEYTSEKRKKLEENSK